MYVFHRTVKQRGEWGSLSERGKIDGGTNHSLFISLSHPGGSFGHVQLALLNCQLENGAGSVRITQNGLQLGELDPCRTVFRCKFEKLLI